MTELIWILLAIGAALLGLCGYLFVRLRRPKEEQVYHFNCPHCRRRIRYLAHQVGHQGMCRRCRRPLTFPPGLS